jgi:hypothetical protein
VIDRALPWSLAWRGLKSKEKQLFLTCLPGPVGTHLNVPVEAVPTEAVPTEAHSTGIKSRSKAPTRWYKN